MISIPPPPGSLRLGDIVVAVSLPCVLSVRATVPGSRRCPSQTVVRALSQAPQRYGFRPSASCRHLFSSFLRGISSHVRLWLNHRMFARKIRVEYEKDGKKHPCPLKWLD